MTLPPYDGPPARRPLQGATVTLPGEGGRGLAGEAAARPEGAGYSPASPGSPASPSLPGSPGHPGAAEPAGSPAGAGPQGAAPAAPPASPTAARWPDGETLPLNLARRPFVNVRPVERLAIILWVLGVVLLVANVTLFMGYLTSSQSTRLKLAGLERDIAREKRDGAVLQGNLGKLGLEQQNREVTFLNRKIDERTFSWSLLFDRMAEVLPDEVRLLRLKPANVVQRDIGLGPRASARELNPPPVTMTMHCEAKDDEAVLRFVDNLFAHPAFSNPNLESEERQDTGWLRFDITVQYQSNVPASATMRPPQARTLRRSQTRAPAAAGVPGALGVPGAGAPGVAASSAPGLVRPPGGAPAPGAVGSPLGAAPFPAA
ncbi:MAG: PilN domain-containing protein, partial [Acidobacteria bacterium]|nr:PilN domain-containing protein [Acidobacteriota bacterium]